MFLALFLALIGFNIRYDIIDYKRDLKIGVLTIVISGVYRVRIPEEAVEVMRIPSEDQCLLRRVSS